MVPAGGGVSFEPRARLLLDQSWLQPQLASQAVRAKAKRAMTTNLHLHRLPLDDPVPLRVYRPMSASRPAAVAVAEHRYKTRSEVSCEGSKGVGMCQMGEVCFPRLCRRETAGLHSHLQCRRDRELLSLESSLRLILRDNRLMQRTRCLSRAGVGVQCSPLVGWVVERERRSWILIQ